MIDQATFQKKYSIDDKMLRLSGFTWDDLVCMHEDFKGKQSLYESTLKDFIQEDLEKAPQIEISAGEKRPAIHSMRYRVKDPEHLIAKAVRKKHENSRKYSDMDATNYERFFTDLAGVRCLFLFKSDWWPLHQHLIEMISDDSSLYVKDPLRDFNPDSSLIYFAEEPKVHVRSGDSIELYRNRLDPSRIISGKTYRSAHYIVKYRGIYLEIQARTLFEESWGEIDHAIVYPYHTDDRILKEYTELLNRLAGLADEMGEFFKKVVVLESEDEAARRALCLPHPENGLKDDFNWVISAPASKEQDQVGEPRATKRDYIDDIIRND